MTKTANPKPAHRDIAGMRGDKTFWPGKTDYVCALNTAEHAHRTELAALQRKMVEKSTNGTECGGETRRNSDISNIVASNGQMQLSNSKSSQTSDAKRADTTVEKIPPATAQNCASRIENSISDAPCMQRGECTTEYYHSIEDVLKRFNLNKLQGMAFKKNCHSTGSTNGM